MMEDFVNVTNKKQKIVETVENIEVLQFFFAYTHTYIHTYARTFIRTI